MKTLEERIKAVNPLSNQKEVRDIYEQLQFQDCRNLLIEMARDKGIL